MPAAVLLIDLDHFKSINDRFGHAIGDRVLQVFADSASDNMRSTDLVGRLGGEEFAAVLYDVDREHALMMAERIRSAFAAAAVEVDGRPVGDRQHRHRVHAGCAHSTSRLCWRRPTRRSITPKSAAVTASRSPRSSSCSAARTRRPRACRRACREMRRLSGGASNHPGWASHGVLRPPRIFGPTQTNKACQVILGMLSVEQIMNIVLRDQQEGSDAGS